jgi:hypothetical protein
VLYNPSISTSTPIITGHNLAHAKRSAIERAFLAADLHYGSPNRARRLKPLGRSRPRKMVGKGLGPWRRAARRG